MVFKLRDEHIKPFMDEYRPECLWKISSDSIKSTKVCVPL